MTKTKINLLTRPNFSDGKRRPPKPPRIPGQRSSLFVLIFSFIMIGFEIAFLWTFYQNLSQKEFQLAQSHEKLKAVFDEAHKKVEELSKSQKHLDVPTEANLMQHLEQDNKQLISVLQTITQHLPSKAWISYLSQKDNEVKVNGFATDHVIVSTFLEQLELSHLFKSVKLVNAEQATQNQHSLKKFTIACEIKPI